MNPILFWVLVALQVIGMLTQVAMVGKPRKPIDAGSAVTSVIVGFLIIASLFIWGGLY